MLTPEEYKECLEEMRNTLIYGKKMTDKEIAHEVKDYENIISLLEKGIKDRD